MSVKISIDLDLDEGGGLRAQIVAEGQRLSEKEALLADTFTQWNRGLVAVMGDSEPAREFVLIVVKVVSVILDTIRPEGLSNMTASDALDELPDDLVAQLEEILRRGGADHEEE
jgi:hypothetical protein